MYAAQQQAQNQGAATDKGNESNSENGDSEVTDVDFEEVK
jgi:hypothetical protein